MESYLPVIWAAIIGLAVAMYVILDGFDLGIGILFPFAETDHERDQMMNSVAPFWDGNETWLVLGGAGMMVAFPLAYSIILPALYLPVIVTWSTSTKVSTSSLHQPSCDGIAPFARLNIVASISLDGCAKPPTRSSKTRSPSSLRRH